MSQHVLVVATHNRGKLEELKALLRDVDVDVVHVGDVTKREIVVVEDEETFEGNAVKKAREVSAATMMLSLADDSGLEVDALGGLPGVRSARYAGERATDAENNAHLLAALDAVDIDPMGVPSATVAFPARFRCVLALVDPFVKDGEPFVVEGVCEGKITRTPRGSGGFGYDPLFLVDGTDKTMAELAEGEKNRISHRGRAFEKMKLVIEKVIAERDALVRQVTG